MSKPSFSHGFIEAIHTQMLIRWEWVRPNGHLLKRILHRLRRLAGGCICAFVGHRGWRYLDLLASGCTRCGAVWSEMWPYVRIPEMDATTAKMTAVFLTSRTQNRVEVDIYGIRTTKQGEQS